MIAPSIILGVFASVLLYSCIEAIPAKHGVGFDKTVHHAPKVDGGKHPRDCWEILKNDNNSHSGIYLVQPDGWDHPLEAICDMVTDGGGWTNVMMRSSGRINFHRDWKSYVHGFGFLDVEFAMGLKFLRALQTNWESDALDLIITLQDREGYTRSAIYTNFSLGTEEEAYPLESAAFVGGDAGDSMAYHQGAKFSTYDFDQDGSDDINCAETYKGGWWYKAGRSGTCYEAQLTGKLINVHLPIEYRGQGIHWTSFRGVQYNHHKMRVLTRPTQPE